MVDLPSFCVHPFNGSCVGAYVHLVTAPECVIVPVQNVLYPAALCCSALLVLC